MIKSSITIIELYNLCYRYGNSEVKALDNINLQICKGEKVVFLGSNGAGKSTLFKHFNAILKPSSGKVIINGEQISKKNISQIRETVGIVFQNPDDQILAPTVEEDVSFGPINMGLSEDEVQYRVHESLKLLKIEDLKKISPHHLSGGQKKMVAIAGIIAMKPDVIVLDEPTAGLDPLSSDNIINLIEKMNKELGITIVLSTHNVELVPSFADRVFLMHHGKIESYGNPMDIFMQADLLAKVHLKLPKVAEIFNLLKNEGVNTDLQITPKDATNEILRLLNGS